MKSEFKVVFRLFILVIVNNIFLLSLTIENDSEVVQNLNSEFKVIFFLFIIVIVNNTFFTFNDRNDSEVVQNLDDVYSIGTFAQIHEAQDLGDRSKNIYNCYILNCC